MKGYAKLTAALAAFALLLVVMGLNTQGAVNAQATPPPGTITVPNKYLCSLATCANETAALATNSSGNILVQGGTGTVEVLNLDVATVSVPNPTFESSDPVSDTNPRTVSINPRTVNIGSAITVVQEFDDPDGTGVPPVGQIRAFNGNQIQITYKPTSGFATDATITVDNVKPILVTNSPAVPLVVRGGVNITFSADLTDGGSGYTSTVGTTGTSDIDDLNATPGGLTTAGDSPNTTTPPGGVRLVVAGNVVSLNKSNFSPIDDGWRVSAELGSDAIQNIGANVPWYFETRDRAGNTRRTSGSIPLQGTVNPGGDAAITDGRFAGGLPTTSFVDTMMKVTRGSASETVAINSFTNGAFTLTIPSEGFFVADAVTSTAIMEGDKFELVGSNLMTIDNKAPGLDSPAATTGIVYSSSKKMPVRGLSARANSIQVNFVDDSKIDDDEAGSGLDPSSVTPAAFTVSGNSVSAVSVQGNSVYLTLAENLDPDEQPAIGIASGVIRDKAGNAYGGGRIPKAADGLGPNLSLSESEDLSNERVTVTIISDEQLGSLPTVSLSRVINSDGDVVTNGDQQCIYAAVAAGEPNTTDPALPRLVRAPVVNETGANTCLDPDTSSTDDLDNRYLLTTPSDIAGQPAGAPSPSQTAAMSYSYAVTATTANPVGQDGGKYNVYVEGVDTQNTENKGKAGHASDANNSAAFTFQLDTVLNGGIAPIVTVSDATAAGADATAPDVEAVDPMIVTVNYAGETGEYPGDSYRTVTLTSAVLTVRFADGSSETTTFNTTTEVSSSDWIKYTIPVLNPKIGAYSLVVKGEDEAGNDSGTTGHTVNWNVVPAKAVDIKLEPGWNLISLPFQPGNPAINSVIPNDHPVDIVMTFDNATQTWLVARRDAETGSFIGDIPVLTANTAYFVRTDKFQEIKLLRPPLATAAAAPPPPPAINVVEGWNLVPIVSNEIPTPDSLSANEYFGTLKGNWLKALTFNTLIRTWDSVAPNETEDLDDDESTPETPVQVIVGKGYWLYATEEGTIIP